MFAGNTPLEDLANLREQWVKPYARLIGELEEGGVAQMNRQRIFQEER